MSNIQSTAKAVLQIASNQPLHHNFRLARTDGIPATTPPKSMQQELKQKLKSDVLNEQRRICPNYKYNDELREIWRDFIAYFIGEHQMLDPNKGILLIGAIGSGKTTIFEILQAALKGRQAQFDSVSVWTLEKEFKDTSLKGIGKYLYNQEVLKVYNRETPINLFIDDIGTEAKLTNNYGNKINVVNDIMLRRYELYKRHGVKTHATANIFEEELYGRYEPKVVDRMREMFDVVYLSNGSWRK